MENFNFQEFQSNSPSNLYVAKLLENFECQLISNDSISKYKLNITKLATKLFLGSNNSKLHLDIKNKNTLTGDIISISFRNETNCDFIIDSFTFKLLKFRLEDFNSALINNQCEKFLVSKKDLSDLVGSKKSSNNIVSNLYTLLLDKSNLSDLILGFLKCSYSENTFVFDNKDGLITVYANYNFGRQILKPTEELNLDSIYIGREKNSNHLISNYISEIHSFENICNLENQTNNIVNKLNNSELLKNKSNLTFNDIKLLFSKKASSITARDKNKDITAAIDGTKRFLIDITNPESKAFIVKQCAEISATGRIVNLKNILPYMKEILKHKLFNPYYEFTKLIKEIRNQIPNIIFAFDDCPIGLAIDNLHIFINEINLINKKSFTDKIFKKTIQPNENAVLSLALLFANSLFIQNTNFLTENKLMKEVLEAYNLNYNVSTDNIKLIEMMEDIEDIEDSSLKFNIDNCKMSTFMRQGNKNNYLLIANFSNKNCKFYQDLSLSLNINIKSGTVENLLHDKSYLINDNKLYIQNLAPMSCTLIKLSKSKEA